jgi:hypothetical protein
MVLVACPGFAFWLTCFMSPRIQMCPKRSTSWKQGTKVPGVFTRLRGPRTSRSVDSGIHRALVSAGFRTIELNGIP